MKKTLLAAALLTGFAGVASAQNSVTLYGRLSTAIIFEQVKVPSSAEAALDKARAGTYNQFGMADGYNGAPSLWGLRGQEDLGNGLTASFNFEQAVTTTTGATSNRVSMVSLSSDAWGQVKLGRDLAPNGTLLAGISPLGTGYGVGSPFSGGFGLLSQRFSNMVSYLSPSISGFRFGAAYSFAGTGVGSLGVDDDGLVTPVKGDAESFGTMNKNRAMMAGVRYANGPIVLGAAYTQVSPARNQFSTTPRAWMVGGAYDLKVVRLHAGYGQTINGLVGGQAGAFSDLGGLQGDDFGTIGSGAVALAGARTNNYFVGVSAPVGDAGQLLFSIGQQRPGGSFDTALTATQTNLGLAYVYQLSQRTSLNASYSYANNLYMLEGVKTNQFGVGIQHLF